MGAKLDEIIKQVNKNAKEDIITKGLAEFNYTRIPFTSPRMNYMTYGGLPIGKLIEFYGEEHGGKTTTALDVVANFQNMFPDKEVLYIDAENTLDVKWAEKIGVDLSNLTIMQPKEQSAEEIFQIIYDAVYTGEVGLWVLDSIGVLLSEQEWEKEIGDKTYGGISAPLTRFSKKIETIMSRYHCTGIGINQLREKINSPYGGTDTPGGRAWKHMCSVRIQFSRGKFIDEKGNEVSRGTENPAGNIVMANATKNKTAPPTRHIGQYTILYDSGIDYISDLIDVAVLYDIIDKRGAWFTVIDVDTGEVLRDKIQGQANLHDVLDNDVDLLQRVEEMVDTKLKAL